MWFLGFSWYFWNWWFMVPTHGASQNSRTFQDFLRTFKIFQGLFKPCITLILYIIYDKTKQIKHKLKLISKCKSFVFSGKKSWLCCDYYFQDSKQNFIDTQHHFGKFSRTLIVFQGLFAPFAKFQDFSRPWDIKMKFMDFSRIAGPVGTMIWLLLQSGRGVDVKCLSQHRHKPQSWRLWTLTPCQREMGMISTASLTYRESER